MVKSYTWHSNSASYQCVSCMRSFSNCAPCTALVSILAGPISSVPRWVIDISLSSIRSRSQKYRTLICRDLADVLMPFSMSAIVDMLSWNMIAGVDGYPWFIKNRLRCSTWLPESDAHTSSASVLDLVTIVCRLDDTCTHP